MEKIDIYNSAGDYQKALELLPSDISKHNADLIIKFLEASAIGKTARKNASKKQSGIRSRLKNLYALKVSARFFNKSLDKLTSKDMEKLISSLNENKLKKVNSKNYSEQTKSCIKKTLIYFLRYTLNENEKFHELTDWIETTFKKKEIPALTEEEIILILNKCNTLQQKVLISILFDTGARIEEFLNIRLGDFIEVKDVVPYFRVTIRNEFSKTQGRTISLLWKQTTPILRPWLEEAKGKGLEEPFFQSTYHGVRKVLAKLGNRALKRRVNAHLFRHSSATYYAGRGSDYFQLCKRYGWQIGSTVPQIYIDRSGIKEKESVEKFKNESLEDLQNQLNKFQEFNQDKTEEIREIKEKMEEESEERKKSDAVVERLLMNPKVIKALEKMAKKESL